MLPLLVSLLSLFLLAEGNIQGQVCTNTSYYGEVIFQDADYPCCSIRVADPDCKIKKETKCINVTETVCEAEVTTDCSPVDCPLTLTKVEDIPHTFVSKKCETVSKQIPHTKTRQVPRKETKQLCQTVWKTNDDGEKEWAGEDNCEEVEWVVYQEEQYEAVLETTEVICTDDKEIPYSTCTETKYDNNQMCLDCKAVATPRCEFMMVERCGEVEVTTCTPQISLPDCRPDVGKTPYQEFHHREKCLFEEDGSLSGGSVTERDGHGHHEHN